MFEKWVREYWGDDIVDCLEEKHKMICKLTKADKKDLYEHMKAEYARLMNLRKNGDVSQVHLVGWI